MEVDALQHLRLPFSVGEGDPLQIQVALHRRQLHSVGGILDVGLGAHQLHKPGEARHALHELLHKGGELADGGDEGGDVEGEGDQVGVVHPPLHDEVSAQSDDDHRHDPHAQLHSRLVGGHDLVIAPLGPPELVVGGVELPVLLRLVGEGLGGADAGQGGLHLPVDYRQLALHRHAGPAHPPALENGEDRKDGNHHKHRQGQLPPDGQQHAEGPEEGDAGDEQILRAVVGQLPDLKEVAGDPAHELSRAVFIKKGEGQGLHVGEQIPADVRFNVHAHEMAPVGDDKVHDPLQKIGQQQNGHHGEKGLVKALGQKRLHGQPGDVRKGQVYRADDGGTEHIQQKQPQVGLIVGSEDGEKSPLLKILVFHFGCLRSQNIVT